MSLEESYMGYSGISRKGPLYQYFSQLHIFNILFIRLTAMHYDIVVYFLI